MFPLDWRNVKFKIILSPATRVSRAPIIIIIILCIPIFLATPPVSIFSFDFLCRFALSSFPAFFPAKNIKIALPELTLEFERPFSRDKNVSVRMKVGLKSIDVIHCTVLQLAFSLFCLLGPLLWNGEPLGRGRNTRIYTSIEIAGKFSKLKQ